MAKASEIVAKAKTYEGVCESPTNSNNVIFNTDYYGHPVSGNYPWCMTYVWDIFRMCDASDLFYDGKKCASCTQLMIWSKNKGKFVKDNFKPGDVIFYNFNTDSKSEHTGIVITDNGSTVTAIEGNTSIKGSQSNGGMVCIKTRKKTQILGVFRPDYAPEKTPYKYELPSMTLKKGMKGYQVGFLQRFLNWYYGKEVLAIDNSFGPATEKVVKQFQKENKLVADGSVGPKTRNKIMDLAVEGK